MSGAAATRAGDSAELGMYAPVTPDLQRRYLGEVLERLDVYGPAVPPEWVGPVSIATLERMAREDAPASGSWVETFARWRAAVQVAEDASMGRVAVLLSAAVYAARLEDGRALEVLTYALRRRWGLRVNLPADLLEARALAPRLVRDYRRLPGILRSHSWRVEAGRGDGGGI